MIARPTIKTDLLNAAKDDYQVYAIKWRKNDS